MNPKEAVIRKFRAEGIDTIFTLMAEDNMGVLSTIKDEWSDSIDIVNARHEQLGVAMADGFSRGGEEIGVVTVGRGPAVAQTGTALKTAARNRSNLLVFVPTFATDRTYDIKDFQQDAFLELMASEPITVRHADTLVPKLDDAFRRLHAGEGPVVLQVSMDVLDGNAELSPDIKSSELADFSKTDLHPGDEQIERIVDVLLDSDATKAPILLVGRGAIRADAGEAILDLAEQIGAYIVTTIQAQGYLSEHPYTIGAMGSWGSPLANEYVVDSDFVLGLGCSMNPYTTYKGDLIREEAKVVHVDVEPTSFEKYTPVDLPVLGDARVTVTALTEALQDIGIERTDEFWTDSVHEEIANSTRLDEGEFPVLPDRIDPRDVVSQLDECLPEKRLVCVDAGHFVRWVVDAIEYPHPDDRIWSLNFGSIGLGMPMGIGAALSAPDRTCVTFCGDSGFMMSLQSLETAVRNDVPLVIVVMNDAALGTEYHNLIKEGLYADAALIESPDLEPVATALGAEGYTVQKQSDLADISEILAEKPDGPVVVDCQINREVRHRSKE